MKKIISIILIINIVFSISLIASAENNSSYTGNNSPIEIYQSNNEYNISLSEYTSLTSTDDVIIVYIDTPNTPNSVAVEWVLDDISQGYKDYINTLFDNEYSNATRLSSATIKYNCHSYAWYSQDINSNEYWMSDPSQFYEDYSYCTVSTPQVGDIICYFDDKGTTDTSDDENLHSGIVTAVLSGTSNGVCGNSDLVTVTSKWGSAGLYSHNGYECPYTAYKNGDGDYVKYYRSTHNYTYANTNSSKHTVTCQECAYSFSADHELNIVSISNSQHQEKCICGLVGAISEHAISYYRVKNVMQHGAFCTCGRSLGFFTHSFVSDDNRYSHCTDCGVVYDTWSDVIIKAIEDELVTK